MGGRGSFSMSHGGVKASSDGGGSLYVSSKTETRPDIRKMFVDELGFKELYGTEALSTAQLGALGIELKRLEREYGVISSGKTYLSITTKPGVKGAAALMSDGSMMMFINPNLHESVGSFRSTLKSEQASGFKTATDGRITREYSYTVRHEYGHLAQYNMRGKNGGATDESMRREVTSIANSKYGAKSSSPSRYGSKNDREFFAESFASMTGGNPNAYGKAMADWYRGKKK